MGKISYYTEEGLQKLKDELTDLKTKGRPYIANQIAEARDKGDLSENAEYDAAKNDQGLLEMKISKLEEVVGNGRIIDQSKLDNSKVSILTTVKIKNKDNGALLSYTIVSEEEADGGVLRPAGEPWRGEVLHLGSGRGNPRSRYRSGALESMRARQDRHDPPLP